MISSAGDPVLIVGGGVAGLACAGHLQRAGLPVQVLEQGDRVGGRVRTDQVEGCLLDRGFQVVLTAYPEFRDLFDEAELQLGRFRPGALVYVDGGFERVEDPTRRPAALWSSMRARVGTLADKWKVLGLRRDVSRGSLEALFRRPEISTGDALRRRGFSASMIERFFRPFLGGIYLESGLETSSRMLEFVMRMFSSGHAALPAGGMQALPDRLAARLGSQTVRTGCRVAAVHADGVELEGGERLSGAAVVLATDASAAARLTGEDLDPGWRATTCLYYHAPRSPLGEPLLVLNGTGQGRVNHLCVPSDVQPSYAAEGALVSVTLIGDEDAATLPDEVQEELRGWFGAAVNEWRHLRTARVPAALPALASITDQPRTQDAQGRFLCGDYLASPSLQGALASGRATAAAVQEQLQGAPA